MENPNVAEEAKLATTGAVCGEGDSDGANSINTVVEVSSSIDAQGLRSLEELQQCIREQQIQHEATGSEREKHLFLIPIIALGE